MDAGFYERVHNFQKVPDEAAQICDLINKQKEEGEVIYLAADDNIAAYVRVYDPSILMPYGRGGKGRTTQAARSVYPADFRNAGDQKSSKICKKPGM